MVQNFNGIIALPNIQTSLDTRIVPAISFLVLAYFSDLHSMISLARSFEALDATPPEAVIMPSEADHYSVSVVGCVGEKTPSPLSLFAIACMWPHTGSVDFQGNHYCLTPNSVHEYLLPPSIFLVLKAQHV